MTWKVHGPNKHLKFFWILVNIFESICVDVIFVVKLSDFVLFVVLHMINSVPRRTVNFFEEIPFGLAYFGLRILLTLCQEERTCKEFLAISFLKVYLWNALSPFLGVHSQLSFFLLNSHFVIWFDINWIDSSLELDWVSFTLCQLLISEVNDVFETMDFTESPKYIVGIRTQPLDLLILFAAWRLCNRF